MSSQNEDIIGRESDYNFLDDVLNKLYDFGGGTGEKKKKLLKKKKKQIKADAVDVEELGTTSDCTDEIDGGLFSQTEPKDTPDVCTAGAATTTLPSQQVETIVFQDPLKKKSKAKTTDIKLSQEKDKDNSDRINLEKARLEVHRFGITGFQKEQRRQFEQERAVMLGAKPPKKEYVNYKVYQQMIKEKKLKEKEELTPDTKQKKKQDKERDRKRKSSSNMLPTGQVGQFKNGMLVLNSKEIRKIKNSRVVK